MLTTPHDLEEFSPETAGVQMLEPLALGRGRRIAGLLSAFFFGQGAAQGINVLAGLFLVRKLSVVAYAQFGLATGFQTVFTVLMDLGLASTIVPLVGERRDDRTLIGRYVRSAKSLRDRMFWILAPFAVLSFLGIMHKQHWGWVTQCLLLASVLLSLFSGGTVSFFSAPLFIFGRLREYYVPQILSGAIRLSAYIALMVVGGLNSWTAAGLGALAITLNARLISRSSGELMSWPAHRDRAAERELIRYILPASPAIIFSAFQSQISLFLVSLFGGAVNIAEITALGRIGQLFAVLMTFNMIVIEPYIARQSTTHLVRTFCSLALLASAACVPVVLLAFFLPGAWLWVIGAKYEGIRPLLGWYILSACMNFVAGLIWVMNRARKWVFWSGSIVEVGLLIVVQVAFLWLVGVRTTRQAVLFSLASSCCYLAAHGYVSVVGFLRGARAVPTAA